jgi:hypothetical protein
LVGIFSPFVAIKRKKMNNFKMSLFFVTSFDFHPFPTDNINLENTHILNIMVESDNKTFKTIGFECVVGCDNLKTETSFGELKSTVSNYLSLSLSTIMFIIYVFSKLLLLV